MRKLECGGARNYVGHYRILTSLTHKRWASFYCVSYTQQTLLYLLC